MQNVRNPLNFMHFFWVQLYFFYVKVHPNGVSKYQTFQLKILEKFIFQLSTPFPSTLEDNGANFTKESTEKHNKSYLFKCILGSMSPNGVNYALSN